MTAVFRVHDTFDLPRRRVFVLRGEILAGTIRTGMLLHMPLNKGFDITAPIAAVESIDGPSFGAATVGLLLSYNDPTERDFFNEWAGAGEELLVGDAEPTKSTSRDAAS